MKYLLYTLLLGTLMTYAQTENDSIKSNQLNEVVVRSKKLNKTKLFITQKTDVISKKEIEFQNFQNTADMISNSGTATVQKSQQGGGSPTLRGFEASRILLLVDGIRMNNLIFRSGHLQNIITVDENMLENVDVFYGSSSSLFGSDALGGAINMTTKKAKFSNGGNQVSGALLSRYSSVNEEKSGHVDINIGLKNFAALTSFSYNDFGNLKMGKSQNGNIPFFGERNFYVETINGQDQLVVNDNKYVQKFTAYKQYDLMQKLAYRQENGNQHEINFQYSTTTDVPRYDRLTDPNGTGLRNAKWYYGPQKRLLGVYTFDKKNIFWGSHLTVNAAYQNVQESRHNRRFNNYNLQNRIEKVAVYSLDFNLKKRFAKSELIYGFENYYDELKSSAYSNNINTGVIQTIDTRYPNGNNNMLRNDLYLYYSEVLSPQTNWNFGARLGYATLKSTIADNTIFELPFTSIEQKNFTYSGTLGIIHKPSKEVSLIANLSSAYRVPNIDDLAKIFESTPDAVIVPNENIKPEKTVTVDMGIRLATESKRFELETTYFYTRFIDAIVTDAFTFNGQNTIDYDGNPNSTVLANQNKGKAFVTGFSTSVKWFLIDNLMFNGNFNYTLGRIVEEDGRYTPLDHIPPYFGKLGLSYMKNRYGCEAYMLYNGKKGIEDYLLNGEDNEQYAPDGGMPAWHTFNIKASFTVFKNATLFAGVENLADIQYRTFASGMNAPGRNSYAGLRVTF